MPKRHDVPLIQLATRIPKSLQRQVKLHCVSTDMIMMDFVAEAVEDRLARLSARKRGRGTV